MSAGAIRAIKSDGWFDGLPQKLSEAVAQYNLPDTADWNQLAELSSATKFEGIEVSGDASVFQNGSYVAPATVYVTLVYDPNSADPDIFDDSFPARVEFSVEGKSVEIISITVDTKSFFK